MSSFGNMKDIYKMQKEAKAMQKKLQEQVISGSSKDGSVKIYLNAAREFEDLKVDDDLLDPDRFDVFKKKLKEAYKDYDKKLQKQMAKQFDMDSLKDMLGN